MTLSNSYGTSNVGDQAILISLTENLRKHLPKLEIDALSLWPEITQKRHPYIKAINSGIIRGVLETFKSIRSSEILIIGGGGLIQDSSSFGNLVFHLSRVLIAKLFGTKVIGIGLGIGPLKKNTSRLLTKIILNIFETIFVRDKESLKLLEKIGVAKNKIILSSDLALLLERNGKEEGVTTKISNLKKGNKRLLGISLRPEPGNHKKPSNSSEVYTLFVNTVIGFVNDCIEANNTHVVFISMHPEQDDIIAEFMKKQLKKPECFTIITGKISPKTIKSCIAQLDILIGMRLHAIIFSALENIPFIAIDYDRKVRYFCQSLELNDQCLSLNEINKGHLHKDLEYSLSNKSLITEKINNNMPHLKEKAKISIDTIIQFLKKNG